MKSISKLLAILLFASPLMADFVGKDTVAQVREAYKNGEYDAFLSEMEKDYQNSLRKNELEGLAAFREAVYVKLSDEERSKLDKKFSKLREERNRQLLKAIEGQPETEFVQKVRSFASQSPENQLSRFHVMVPGSGENLDANRFIDLDLELEYKLIHLDAPLAQGDKVDMRLEKQLALKMQNADRLAGLSAVVEDAALKNQAVEFVDQIDAYLAWELDAADLHQLGKGKVQPQNALEEKVAEILASYQAEWRELAKR